MRSCSPASTAARATAAAREDEAEPETRGRSRLRRRVLGLGAPLESRFSNQHIASRSRLRALFLLKERHTFRVRYPETSIRRWFLSLCGRAVSPSRVPVFSHVPNSRAAKNETHEKYRGSRAPSLSSRSILIKEPQRSYSRLRTGRKLPMHAIKHWGSVSFTHALARARVFDACYRRLRSASAVVNAAPRSPPPSGRGAAPCTCLFPLSSLAWFTQQQTKRQSRWAWCVFGPIRPQRKCFIREVQFRFKGPPSSGAPRPWATRVTG